MSISKEDRDRITESIRAAEAKTSGEIVCVLAETSTRSTASPVFIAAAVALILPWLLTAFTAMTVFQILSLQVVVFLALLMLLCVPRVRVALMPRRARRAIAYQVAMEQFVSRGLARNRNQSGVLIFVSLAERYARIIVGTEIAARVQTLRAGRKVLGKLHRLNARTEAPLVVVDDADAPHAARRFGAIMAGWKSFASCGSERWINLRR